MVAPGNIGERQQCSSLRRGRRRAFERSEPHEQQRVPCSHFGGGVGELWRDPHSLTHQGSSESSGEVFVFTETGAPEAVERPARGPTEEDVLDPAGAVLLVLAPNLEQLVLVMFVDHLEAPETVLHRHGRRMVELGASLVPSAALRVVVQRLDHAPRNVDGGLGYVVAFRAVFLALEHSDVVSCDGAPPLRPLLRPRVLRPEHPLLFLFENDFRLLIRGQDRMGRLQALATQPARAAAAPGCKVGESHRGGMDPPDGAPAAARMGGIFCPPLFCRTSFSSVIVQQQFADSKSPPKSSSWPDVDDPPLPILEQTSGAPFEGKGYVPFR
eukprot:CAMPEP_0180233362 /NCGR_PEP_ID=MMETSP0987-20121128/28034_1 /TAXON_ID=697907 /ORGANISM="non described non described, Strain CCMP2293" /LENGTH=326 /DNA_ID=CAMNT_0022199173 /DNA_START=328 /DNA_END=1306 /DNA_ORIENTATION=+